MNTFIIGAGFTKAVFPDAPLNRDLLDALAGNSTDSAAAVLRDTYKTDDIEIALTRLDSDIAVSQGERGSLADDGHKLRRRIETELGDYFGSFLASEELLAQSPWLATVEIAYLMLEALSASATAMNLVIIGSALRPEDGFLTLILTNFLRQPSWRTRRVFIVDPAANAISSRLKKFWGVNVSSQIVPIEERLEASVSSLVESLSKRKRWCGSSLCR